ncbi:unnamed protein product [Mytilus edulis]|uniref:YqaJ viral recombinase domain-containing protein n=1 Tax=Mytilus edulis TaxID=6550 RepID=A0A8S3PTC9_MYTED|nr:unnamed protein product [Mytilus edulis]
MQKSKLAKVEEGKLQKIPPFEPDNYIFANKIRRTVDGVELPGDGTCKHVAALLFGMQRFCQDLSDRSVISVTDKAAKWVNPVRTSAPVKITSLDLRKLSGFVIDNNSPYLGCSTDGLLECKCCGQGCLEIKCPYKFSEETPINAACLDKTNFHIENDTPLMKRNDTSPYYCQIQCQLAVTKRKWCDFVLFTFKGVHHERIPFDEQFWSNVFPKLASFYSSYVLPKILLV